MTALLRLASKSVSDLIIPPILRPLDLTHDIVDRIEHVGELAWRGGDVIVVRLPIDRERGKLARVVHVIYLDVVDSRDPLRLDARAQPLLDILFDQPASDSH